MAFPILVLEHGQKGVRGAVVYQGETRDREKKNYGHEERRRESSTYNKGSPIQPSRTWLKQNVTERGKRKLLGILDDNLGYVTLGLDKRKGKGEMA